jgi:hypothetical protein
MGVGLEKNYGYTMWASNKAEEVADDGKITKSEIADIAKNCGNKDGKLDENDLVDAGFSHADAKRIFNELKRTGFQEVAVDFEKSLLQKGVAATGAVVGQVKQQVTTKVAEIKKEAVAVVGQVKQEVAAKYQAVKKTVGEVKAHVAQKYEAVKKATIAKVGEIKEGAARLYTQAKKDLKAIGTEIAHTAKHVVHNAAEFGKGVGHGIVHAGEHLVHGVVDFAKEHPVITGAIVIGAAALITVATGGVGGPVAAGIAGSILSGMSTGGMILGGGIAVVKGGQSLYEGVVKGDWEKAGERFGEGAFEAAVTFAPGAALKGVKNLVHSTEAVAKGLKATGDLVQDVEKLAEIEVKAAELFSKAGNLHTMEKILHTGHELFEAHEISSVKVKEVLHLGTEGFEHVFGGGHEAPAPEAATI